MAVNQFYDETAGHRIVQGPMVEARPFLRSALLGAYVELVSTSMRAAVAAAQSGNWRGHVDGGITLADIVAIEPWAWEEVRDGLLRYGYMAATDDPSRFVLVQHDKLAHWDTAETLWWLSKRRKDNRDEKLRLAVRYRDGDQCRVCHVVVHWRNNTDEDSGTLDHVNPRQEAPATPESVVVACRRCNGIRSDRRDANEFAPHQPAPEHPYYTESTAAWLAKKGYKDHPAGGRMIKTGERWLLPTIEVFARPVPETDTAATRDPASSGTPRTQKHPQEAQDGSLGRARPGTGPDTATTPARPASQADTAQRDPASDGTPRTSEVRPELDRNSIEARQANSPPIPSLPPGKPPFTHGGLPGGDREGMGTGGAGSGPRRRGRRARKAKPRSVNRADRQE